MKIKLSHNDKILQVDLNDPIDISIPLIPDSEGPNCFWAPRFTTEPVRSGDWVGDTQQGGNLNFKTVTINPHGNGTHTECVGHISKEVVNIGDVLQEYHYLAQVVSIIPQKQENGDRIVTLDQVKEIDFQGVPAFIIRTIPNHSDKLTRVYSGTNPAYFHHDALKHIADQGVVHLLIDLPSVDREEDEGLLLGHKAFWNYPATIDKKKTITEMVYLDNVIEDGLYLLNLQIVSFELDASPSKPVLYRLIN